MIALGAFFRLCFYGAALAIAAIVGLLIWLRQNEGDDYLPEWDFNGNKEKELEETWRSAH